MMKTITKQSIGNLAFAISLTLGGIAQAEITDVGKGPWVPADEIGRLNLMTEASPSAVLSRIRLCRRFVGVEELGRRVHPPPVAFPLRSVGES
jgi:hypothetical protein